MDLEKCANGASFWRTVNYLPKKKYRMATIGKGIPITHKAAQNMRFPTAWFSRKCAV